MDKRKENQILIQIGKKIKDKRVNLNLSQENLSIDAEITKNQIGRIERGEINTSIISLIKISKVLKLDFSDLFKNLDNE